MIALDFDGVMMNSSIEIAVTAARALGLTSVESTDALPKGYLERFTRNHCRASRAGDMIVLGRWALSASADSAATAASKASADRAATAAPGASAAVLNEGEFRHLVVTDPMGLPEREELFFSTRMDFISAAREKWLSLNTPFEPLWQTILSYSRKPLIIITRKNKAAVLELCGHFGLSIAPEHIYAGDEGTAKSVHLENVLAAFPGETFLFVDDSLHNLRELQESHGKLDTIELAFALWGFVTPEEPEQARSQGLCCLTQNQLIERMSEE